MDFQLKTLDLAGAAAEKTDALVLLVAESARPGAHALDRAIADARKAGDFEPKAGKVLALYGHASSAARHTVLAGVGDGSARAVHKAVVAAVGALKSRAVRRLTVVLPALPDTAAAVQATTTAAADASYVFTTTKSKPEPRKLEKLTLAVPDANAVRAAFDCARATVAGVEFAKEWGNRPANFATPTLLADAAKTLVTTQVRCEVLGPREVAKLGMGSFMAVAKGSEEELRFIVLRYNGAAKTDAPVVLVGKGITFDTGGISIKPSSEMDEMKFDMCGAASVLGTFKALGELKPAINVVGLIPSCENMPDGRALKPSDVVTSMSGQTIEVLNTDAEGRLVLCDALTYAERFDPRAVIDIATLTGACVVALGAVRSGMFSADDALAAALHQAGEAALDPCWRLPLDDEYAEGLKTPFADVANIGGRVGGAITAAKFLQRFAAKFPWAHLDIAGSAWKGGASKGATGRPVPLLLNYLLAQVERRSAATKKIATKTRAAS
ncbi:leucyl aminopeptidase [Xylophilus ampelinus]|uniref:Probable cytosol aminopeptidase n=1 Tax=Xylophilus ampelinus TaxID=54067 RepID=A0A318SLL8_9BURK|nr:leucyl aminopeptidase [Xylophilus ampelinus]MCS4509057.1 leucyl aminopeptidase [Xylophilus ampelinus]PYE79916.1 aminopeptidase A [Xylophilus ampelinus]